MNEERIIRMAREILDEVDSNDRAPVDEKLNALALALVHLAEKVGYGREAMYDLLESFDAAALTDDR